MLRKIQIHAPTSVSVGLVIILVKFNMANVGLFAFYGN